MIELSSSQTVLQSEAYLLFYMKRDLCFAD
jgi:hypothetical protein